MRLSALTLACLWIFVPSVSAAVRILDDQSRPISGAAAEMIVTGGWESAVLPPIYTTGTSEANGGLSFGVPAIDGLMLFVDHPAYAPAVFQTGREAPLNEVRLQRGKTWCARLVPPIGASEVLDGEVCAGGEIVLEFPALKRRWRRCAAVEHGAFQLEGLPDGRVEVEVQVPGFLPVVETVDPRRTKMLRLDHGVLLRGVVTDTRERSIAGAAVRAGKARAITDKNGRFAIAVNRFPVTIAVQMAGFRRWRSDIERIRQMDVRLTPAEQVSGVLIGEYGAPVHRATVEITRFFDNGSRKSTWRTLETGEQGDFNFEVPDQGRYTLAFRAPGYQELRFSEVDVPKQSTLPIGFLSLRRGPGVRGVVLDRSSGKPTRGALIEVVPAGALLLQTIGEVSIPTAVTPEDGQFSAGGFEVGRYLVRIRRSELAAVHRLVDLAKDEIVDLGMVMLDAGVELRGRVVDRTLQPVRAVPVRIFDPAREMLQPFATTTSDDDGRFKFSRVSPDRYRVEIGAERLLSAQEVVVPATAAHMDLDLQVSGPRIRGLVTRGGVRVPGGTVRLESQLDPSQRRGKIMIKGERATLTWGMPQSSITADVDGDGSFVMNGAPVGLVRVWYGGVRGETCFRSAVLSDDAEIALPIEVEGHVLEGRLLDASMRTGVAGAVSLFDGDGSLTQVQSGADGAFRFTDLQRGVYAIEARASGYLPAGSDAIFIGEKTPPQIVELQAGQTGHIEVALSRGDGNGVKGIPVTIFNRRGVFVRSLPTLSSGRRRFDDLPPGKYFVCWSDPLAGAGCSAPVEVDAFRAPAVSLTLVAGATIVVGCPHHRCSGAAIELLEVSRADGLDMTALLSGISPALRLSNDGDVSLGRLAAGRYRFRLWVVGQRWDREVTVGSTDLRVMFE